jgi:hypothetical protein
VGGGGGLDSVDAQDQLAVVSNELLKSCSLIGDFRQFWRFLKGVDVD